MVEHSGSKAIDYKPENTEGESQQEARDLIKDSHPQQSKLLLGGMSNGTLDVTKDKVRDCLSKFSDMIKKAERQVLALKDVEDKFRGQTVYNDMLKKPSSVLGFIELVPTLFEKYEKVLKQYREYHSKNIG